MGGARDIDCDELRQVIVSESREDALFQAFVVVDYDTDICSRRYQVKILSTRMYYGFAPLRTSLISPGGDCNTKLDATWTRSSTWLIAVVLRVCLRSTTINPNPSSQHDIWVLQPVIAVPSLTIPHTRFC